MKTTQLETDQLDFEIIWDEPSGFSKTVNHLYVHGRVAFGASNSFKIYVVAAPSHADLFKRFKVPTSDLFCQGCIIWHNAEKRLTVNFKNDDYCLWESERETISSIRRKVEAAIQGTLGFQLTNPNARPLFKPVEIVHCAPQPTERDAAAAIAVLIEQVEGTACPMEAELARFGVVLEGDVLARYREWASLNPRGGDAQTGHTGQWQRETAAAKRLKAELL